MIFYALLTLLVLLFAFVDVWYIVRFVVIAVKSRFNRRNTEKDPYTVGELTGDFVKSGIVLPSDLDVFVHMNNSKYFKEFDLARIEMAAELGFLDVLKKHGGLFVVGAGNIRYKKSMKLFQTYKIRTRIVCWDERAFYVEQEMVTTGGSTVTATMNTKIAMKGITTDVFIRAFCGDLLPSPDATDEIESWQETLAVSSKYLQSNGVIRKRRGSITSLNR